MNATRTLTEAEQSQMSSFLVDAISDGDDARITELLGRGADPYVAYRPRQSDPWITPIWWLIKNTDRSMLPHVVGTGLAEVPAGNDRLGRDGGASWDIITGLVDVDRDEVDVSRTIESVQRIMEPNSPALAKSLSSLVEILTRPGGADRDFDAGQKLMSAVLAGAGPAEGGWERLMNTPVRLDKQTAENVEPRSQVRLLKLLLWTHEDRKVEPVLAKALQDGLNPNTAFAGVPLLHLAVAGNHVRCAQTLIEAGADVQAKCESDTEVATYNFKTKTAAGMTAIEFARDIQADQVIPVIQVALTKCAVDRVISAAQAHGAGPAPT